MFDFINYGSETLQVFLLVLLRASGIFIASPILSNRAIPVPVKAGLVIMISGLVVASFGATELPLVTSVWQLAGLASKELLVGFIIGLVFQLLFLGVKTGGGLLGYQIGFAMVQMPDFDSSEQVSIISRFWVLVATLIFFIIGGHHQIIHAFADSYEFIPAGEVIITSSVMDLIIKYSAYVFVIAIKASAPILVALFLTDLALGTIAKLMPTMNVFFVGFPIKIGVGLTIVALSLPMFSYFLEKVTHYLDSELRLIFMAMGKA